MSQPFVQLDADWRRLAASSAARDALARWSVDLPLTGAGGLDALLARRLGVDYKTADVLLLALTRRAASDAVAAQCVLRAITPGLVRLAPRTPPDPSRDDTDAELIATASERIVTYTCLRTPAVSCRRQHPGRHAEAVRERSSSR